MDKKQMTEEEAIKIIPIIDNTEVDCFPFVMGKLKQAGYITRPVWEEAEEDYQKTWELGLVTPLERKQHDAIIALKEKAGIK